MPRIALPPGCYGLKFANGSKTPNVRPGSSISVTDEQAKAISKSSNAALGIISGTQTLSIGTKKGCRCACGFLPQAWSKQCPRCGEPVNEED